ncbi:MAG: transglutaminase-like domain-containing protein [Pirellulaceae bacterium]|nr:transglutaminase-like domain-containing protein [Pirellulaceae bacterium]
MADGFSNAYGQGRDQNELKTREFQLHYTFEVEEIPKGATVRTWTPIPQNSDHQTVQIINMGARASKASRMRIKTEPAYGNQMAFFEIKKASGNPIFAGFSYLIERREVRSLQEEGDKEPLSEKHRKLFLSANEKVPIAGKPLELLVDTELPAEPLSLARLLYDKVGEHVVYDKSKPGYGTGDSLWVCESQFGNCTDFHSLFISLARSQQIPACFEIGFPLPADRGDGLIEGYHCWGMFHIENKGWIPVDISEGDKNPALRDYYFGNLSENRVAFTIGRDLELVPKQNGPPLNYFIYPHVEIDGEKLSADQIKVTIEYAD